MNMVFIYWVIGILALIYSITMLVFIIKIWSLLNEVVLSGAIPLVLRERAKKNARDIIKMGYIQNPILRDWVSQTLSKSGDEESIQLLNKLNSLKKV